MQALSLISLEQPGPKLAAGQGGVVLFVALVALIVMSLAGISLFRSVDSVGLISGNLAYRQAALTVSDVGVEQAIAFLHSVNSVQRHAELSPRQGYWPTRQVGFNPLTYDWAAAGNAQTVTVAQGSPNNGDVIRFVIHRLCDNTGEPAAVGTGCSTAPASASGGSVGGDGASRKIFGYGEGTPDPDTTNSPYYRITTRVDGARNSIAYTQVLIHFQ
jgi:Tfp pilus assembly protein PilX